jgi:hypothetical protein
LGCRDTGRSGAVGSVERFVKEDKMFTQVPIQGKDATMFIEEDRESRRLNSKMLVTGKADYPYRYMCTNGS